MSVCKPTLAHFVQPLLQWYHQHARMLPWRENTHPYCVWVSEIMLQQTRVETVKPYFERFMMQLPTLECLANAPEAQLLKLWEGLGYYSRARNLQKAAQYILRELDGIFPCTYDGLRMLPGVGEYTAGAVASICFGLPTPAVDGNVLRVVTRFTHNNADIALLCTKREITAQLQRIYPAEHSGALTQAIMELGATVCTPTSPKCAQCPLHTHCAGLQAGLANALPVKTPKKPRKKEEKTVFLLFFRDTVALRQRAQNGLLGGLWEFPNAPGSMTHDEAGDYLRAQGLAPLSLQAIDGAKHCFTHIEWHMSAYIATCKSDGGGLTWVSTQTLTEQLTLPSAFKPFLSALRAHDSQIGVNPL